MSGSPGTLVRPSSGTALQRAVGPAGGERAAIPSSVAQVIASPGSALHPGLRHEMEKGFGYDFSKVRIHTGMAAAKSAQEVNALAYTVGHSIAFGRDQFAPATTQGQRLLAHELTHVVQQSAAQRLQPAGQDASAGGGEERGHFSAVATPSIPTKWLQRTPAEADALISAHTSWANLNEAELGRELLRMAMEGQIAQVDEVMDELYSVDRDDVAYGFMVAVTEQQLGQLAASPSSRRLLQRLFDELTAGEVDPTEQEQADRILQATTRSTVGVAAFDAATTSSRTKIFPFRLPGFTVLSDAPIEARREAGGIWVHTFVRVLGTDEFRAETATLPNEYFVNGIVLPENEVIGVRFYDEGGVIRYATPLLLLQLANATTTRVLEKILEAAGIGLTLGTGALADLGIEASLLARVALWGDRAAFVLGTVTSLLREHRSWLIEQFGQGFMDAVDTLYSAAAIYGMIRVALEAPRIVLALRNSYRTWRTAATARTPRFSVSEQSTIQEVTQSTDELLQQVDSIQSAHTQPPQTAEAAAPTTPAPAAETASSTAPIASAADTPPQLADRPPPLGSAHADANGVTFSEPSTAPVTTRRGSAASVDEPRPVGRGEPTPARDRPAATSAEADEAAELADDLDDLGRVIDQTTEGTGTGSRSPSATEELEAAPDPQAAIEAAERPRPQRLRPVLGHPESMEAARAAGVPDEVLHSGTVFTRLDFPEVVPEGAPPVGRSAPDVLPQAEELERGIAGRRPTTAPDPSDVQHTELLGDIDLTRRQIEGAGGQIEEIAINRRQRTGSADAPTAASAATRPDVQLAVIDAQLNGRRITIEYDRAPGTRSMDHAREILSRDPDAIVIIKIIGFE